MLKHELTLLIALFSLAVACGDSDPGTGPDGPDDDSIARAVIGPGGGRLVSKDGKATLVVPPGALERETELSVKPSDEGQDPQRLVGGSLYDFGPDGLIFQVPAELTLAFDASRLPSGASEPELFVVKRFADGIHRFHRTRRDQSLHTATATIPGFSHYGVACCMRIDPPRLRASIGADRKVTLSFDWQQGVRIDNLVIERAKNNALTALDAEYSVLHPSWPSATPFVDSGVNGPAAIYHYRVRNLVGSDVSWPSNETYVADFGDHGPPPAPSDFRASVRSTARIDLRWSVDPSALTYALERSTSGGDFEAVIILPFSEPSYSDLGRAPDTDYQYRLRGINELGESAWSYVAARTTLSWADLGAPLNQSPTAMASTPALAFDASGVLYAAWGEAAERGGGLYVASFDGSSWQLVGAGQVYSGLAEDPALVIDASGRLVVAANRGGIPEVSRFDGTRWALLPGNPLSGPAGTFFAQSFSLAVTPSGQVLLAFDERVSGSNDGAVRIVREASGGYDRLPSVQLPSELNGWPTTPSLIAGSDGNPIVAWTRGNTQGQAHMMVSRYDGNSWLVSGPLNANLGFVATAPRLVLDRQGNPALVFIEADTGRTNVELRRWSVDHFESAPIANTGSGLITGPHLAFEQSGNAIVSYTEQGASFPQSLIHARRFDGTSWSSIGDPVIDVRAYAMIPVVAVSPFGGIAVGWREDNAQGTTAFAKVRGFGL